MELRGNRRPFTGRGRDRVRPEVTTVQSLVLFLAVVAVVVIILYVSATATRSDQVHNCPVGTVSVGGCP